MTKNKVQYTIFIQV